MYSVLLHAHALSALHVPYLQTCAGCKTDILPVSDGFEMLEEYILPMSVIQCFLSSLQACWFLLSNPEMLGSLPLLPM